MQFAAGQQRLEHVGGVHGALGGPGTDDRVQLVNEEHDLALGCLDLLEHRLQPFLELAPILGPGDQRPQVQPHDPPPAQRLRHIAAHDPLRQPFDDGRLTNPRIADQHGIVLRAPRQHLDDAPDFVVAADDRIELARLRRLREVPAVTLQRLVLGFWILVGHALVTPHRRQHLIDAFRRDSVPLKDLAGRPLLRIGHNSQEQVLGADVLVLEALHLLMRAQDHLPQPRRHRDLGCRAVNLGRTRQGLLQIALHQRGIGAQAAEDRTGETVLLL